MDVPMLVNGPTERPSGQGVVRRHRRRRWVTGSLVALAVAWIAYQLVTNPGFQWPIVVSYFTNGEILSGLLLTIELTAVTQAVGIAIGIILAMMQLSESRITAMASTVYVWFFRGTPVLVQLIFWYNLAYLFPRVVLEVPGGMILFSISTNSLISPFTAALLGLGLNEGAYMAEIVRGGILSVDAGQIEAGRALGLTSLQVMRRIVLPQAMRSIVPATGNQTIGMLKYTSLASVVSLQELLNSAETIYTRTFQTIPLLIVASLWYLVLTTVLSWGQYYVERHYARGSTRELPPTPVARLVTTMRDARARLAAALR
jgi:polar amino acid transport system permease protein